MTAVIPLVLNQGTDRWAISTSFEEALALPDEAVSLLHYVPKFEHVLVDLTQLDPDRDEDHSEMKIILQLMKLVRLKQAYTFLTWLNEMRASPSWHEDIGLMRLSYVYLLNADALIDVEGISDSLIKHPALKNDIMSLAQRFIAQGEAQGEARGERIGSIRLLEQLMGRAVSTRESLNQLDLEQLDQRFIALEKEYNLRFKQA